MTTPPASPDLPGSGDSASDPAAGAGASGRSGEPGAPTLPAADETQPWSPADTSATTRLRTGSAATNSGGAAGSAATSSSGAASGAAGVTTAVPIGGQTSAEGIPPGGGYVPSAYPGPKPRRSRGRRILKWTSISLAVLLVLIAGGGAIGYFYFTGRVTTETPQFPPGTVRPTKVATKAENFVLIGSDTRSGASGKGTGAGHIAGARSDTTIIMHIAANNAGATLVSIPRDSYEQIPSCSIGPDGQKSAPTVGKFNEAFSIGSNAGNKYGPSCTIHTIETLTGIHIDHYAVVDFAGFKKMVGALGGVNVCISKPLYDPIEGYPGNYHGSGLNLPAGKSVKVDGDQALALMRARYNLDGGGDIPRIKRQQQFIGAMIRKATASSLLLDPIKLFKFLRAATGSLTTDGFGLGTMKTLAHALQKVGAGGVRILTVPLAETLPPGVPTADVAWDPVKAPALWNAIIHDQPIPGTKGASPSASPSPGVSPSISPSPTASPSLIVAPSSIHLRVLNGSGVAGRATAAANALRAQGFKIVSIGDADSATYESTVVEYGPTKNESSQTTAASIPGAVRQADSTQGTTITVIIGHNYNGVVPVAIGSAAPTSSPSPSATPSIASVTAAKTGCLA